MHVQVLVFVHARSSRPSIHPSFLPSSISIDLRALARQCLCANKAVTHTRTHARTHSHRHTPTRTHARAHEHAGTQTRAHARTVGHSGTAIYPPVFQPYYPLLSNCLISYLSPIRAHPSIPPHSNPSIRPPIHLHARTNPSMHPPIYLLPIRSVRMLACPPSSRTSPVRRRAIHV